MSMVIEKPDGWLELGCGVDDFQPGQKVTGMHANGPSSKWWRAFCAIRANPSEWVRQPDHRDRHWQDMADAANSCEEFWMELRKSQ